MASKSKSKGPLKKSPPATKPHKVVAVAAKPKAMPVVAKPAKKPASKTAKPVGKVDKSVKATTKPPSKPVKAGLQNAKKSSGPAKSATKSLMNGTSIQSTQVLKPNGAKVLAKKAAPTLTPKVSIKAKPNVSANKVPVKDAKKTIPSKPTVPVAKSVTVLPKAEKSKKEASAVKEPAIQGKDARKAKPDLFKGPFFQEVPVGSAAIRKSRAPQAPVVALRKPKGEESHDELIARIEKELLTVRMAGKKVHRVQVCTKCCINPVDPSFMVDRDTGYCTECALVLGLGHTREARQQNFHPSLMKSEEVVVAE